MEDEEWFYRCAVVEQAFREGQQVHVTFTPKQWVWYRRAARSHWWVGFMAGIFVALSFIALST